MYTFALVLALGVISAIAEGDQPQNIQRRAFNGAEDVTFQLYTNASRPTRFVIHGWQSKASKMASIKDAYLSVGDYNVILVDWSGLAGSLYSIAKGDVVEVGEYVATLVDHLVSRGASLSNIHIAGHSLGAHVAGIAGNRLTSGTLGKITGMDPALPLFGDDSLANRLDSSDASFVEIIHTCSGLLGFSDPIGHADFYPNKGTIIQPGCGIDLAGSCSHSRSHVYFEESITSGTGFYGYKCSSWNTYEDGGCRSNSVALMGEYTDTRSNPQQQTTLDLFWGRLGHFNSSWPTRIVIHGRNSDTQTVVPIKDDYLTKEDSNVILLDWSVPAKDLFYVFAKRKVSFIGEKLGSLIDSLVTKGLNLTQLHIIGHGLGAHIAGVAGKRYDFSTISNVDYISVHLHVDVERRLVNESLEPASLFYEMEKLENRLDKSDADFVEIIYTSHPENNSTLGHADFYVNKDAVQPGCENIFRPFEGRKAANSWHTNFPSQWMFIPDDKGVPQLAIMNKKAPRYDGNIEEDVEFRLYTRSNRDQYYRLYANDVDNLKASNFNPAHPTKMIVHGYTSNADTEVVYDNKEAYLDNGDYNVIGIDWSVLCPPPLYYEAVENAKYAGEHTAALIEFLVEQTGATYESFHLMGHSLGAQMIGFAGAATKSKIGRLTALDAAYPMFGNVNSTGRLDPSDAILVDAIHTCGGSFGFDDPIGHVDFYPNGGLRPQPGCGEDILGVCSHIQATTFYTRTLREPDVFPAIECLSLEEAESGQCTGTATATMGEFISFEKYGLYYLDTTFTFKNHKTAFVKIGAVETRKLYYVYCSSLQYYKIKKFLFSLIPNFKVKLLQYLMQRILSFKHKSLETGRSAVNSRSLNFSPLTTSDTKLQWMFMSDDEGVPRLAILNNYGPKYDGNIIEDVEFRLYTRSNRDEYYRIYASNLANLQVSTFNPSHPTKLLVHGFTSSADSSLVINNKNAYLDNGEYNIIGVDWSVLCPGPVYGTACENARYAGEYTAKLIDYLVEETGAKYENFHIIGHSLGAQLAGFAGGATKEKIGRITGSCSHSQSVTFFSRTVKEPEAYPAKECLNLEEAESGQCTGTATAMMGESIEYEKYGLYYLDTTV
ncbi:hypothetical protein C0J52_22637 [Blattella germanica]|nr:hypothetical protein C0J52_22637 [Blattella germanica]